MTVQPPARPTPDPVTLKAEQEAHSTKTVEMRARAVAVLAALDESRELDRRANRYKPVTTTVGDAEQLARDVIALTDSALFAGQREPEPGSPTEKAGE